MNSLLLALVAALVVAVMVLFSLLKREQGAGSAASRERNRVAQAGEHEALELLLEAGFELVEEQARGSWFIEVDGEELEIKVRADLLVERDGLLFVAEVKTGSLAPSLKHAATRRQLLEYSFVFEPDGVLLVDMQSGTIHEISFPT